MGTTVVSSTLPVFPDQVFSFYKCGDGGNEGIAMHINN